MQPDQQIEEYGRIKVEAKVSCHVRCRVQQIREENWGQRPWAPCRAATPVAQRPGAVPSVPRGPCCHYVPVDRARHRGAAPKLEVRYLGY